jgi:N-acetylglucosamine-6-phosphate deacetylase
VATHRRAGTGTVVASLVSDTLDNLLNQIAQLLTLVESGELAGIHLEGPWLAPERRGAHDPSKLSLPSPDAVQAITELSPGVVRMVTIAPELPGASAAIERLVDAGIVVSLGHTEAGYGETWAAFELGASGVTHLFNGMPKAGGPAQAALDYGPGEIGLRPKIPGSPRHSPRRPGMTREGRPGMTREGRCPGLTSEGRRPQVTGSRMAVTRSWLETGNRLGLTGSWLELIFDGHHVPAEQAAELCRKEPGRVVLITDAMAAAGMGDGDFTLGGLPVQVAKGVARLESGNLAGSTITLADAVVNAVAAGVPLAVAVREATANPADYLGLRAGRLEPGYPAGFLELDESGHVVSDNVGHSTTSG